MIEENQTIYTENGNNELENKSNSDLITLKPEEIVNKECDNVVDNIIKIQNPEDLKRELELFNLNQSKKNILRVVKMNELLDKVQDQAIERIDKNPDEFSNVDLMNYMKVASDQIDKSQKIIDKIEEKPLIQINNTKNDININIEENQLSKESKIKVVEAIDALTKLFQEEVVENTTEQDYEIIDAEIEETKDETIKEGE